MKISNLMKKAQEASKYAYSPYSHFQVGAAIKSKSGNIYTGCNVENASYGLTNCAERTAVFKAISEGEKEFTEIAIYTNTEKLFTPCGACRQVLAEFNLDMKVIVFNNNELLELRLSELLPHAF